MKEFQTGKAVWIGSRCHLTQLPKVKRAGSELVGHLASLILNKRGHHEATKATRRRSFAIVRSGSGLGATASEKTNAR
jgi:hypothetical protein